MEVQVFGDGRGRWSPSATGTARSSAGNQKVVEEAPAPGLPDTVRRQLAASAAELVRLGRLPLGRHRRVRVRRGPRAGVLPGGQHPSPGGASGHRGHPRRGPRRVDAAARPGRHRRGTGAGQPRADTPWRHASTPRIRPATTGPARDCSPGSRSRPDVRVDSWVETGTEVTTSYDPMLAKVIAHGRDRAEALAALDRALAATRIDGIETNLGLVRAALGRRRPWSPAPTPRPRSPRIADPTPRIEVTAGGVMTTVQDWPGRTGHWQVGVPPSGPMDSLSFRLGNRALGNDDGAPGLECTLQGPDPAVQPGHHASASPARRHRSPSTAEQVALWEPFTVPAGGIAGRRRAGGARSADLRPARRRRSGRPGFPGQCVDLHAGPVRRARRTGAAHR